MRPDGYLRFPASPLRSIEEFRLFRSDNSDLLDERYRRERALASKEAAILLDGTCGLCLRVTRFESRTAGGESMPTGAVVPNWREQQFCDCGCDLNSRERALVHFAASRLGDADWYRAAVFGGDAGMSRYLATILPQRLLWPRLAAGPEGHISIPAETASCHMVLSADYLQTVPPLDRALAEVARVLAPGGIFVFTVPFHFDAEGTASDLDHLPRHNGQLPAFAPRPVHAIGWDILDRLRQSDFRDCAAHCYWSEELGYLGAYNMIFMAYR